MKRLFLFLSLFVPMLCFGAAAEPLYINRTNPIAYYPNQIGVLDSRASLASGAYSRWVAAGVVLTNGAAGALDSGFFGEAAVLNQYGKYYVYYIINTNTPNTSTSTNWASIGLSVGPDIYHQVKMGRIFTPSASGWDSGYVQGPYVFSENGTNCLYTFAATNRLGFEQGLPAIGMAYSTTPSNFTRVQMGNLPLGMVLSNGVPGQWDDGFLAKPFVMKNKGLYWLFYNGQQSGVLGEHIGAAVSTNLFLDPWHRLSQNPLVSNGAGTLTSDPQILRNSDGTFLMVYTVGRHLNTAWSADLTNWIQRGECILDNYYIPNSDPDYGSLFNPFTVEFSQSPCLVLDGGTTTLLVDNRTLNNGWIFAMTPSTLGQSSPSNLTSQAFQSAQGGGAGITFPTPFLPWHPYSDNNWVPPDESSGLSNSVFGIHIVNRDGALTNLYFLNSPAPSTASRVTYPTNATFGLGGTAISVPLSNSYCGINTNAAINIVGLSGIDTTGTNGQWETLFVTNTSASAIPITMDATFNGFDSPSWVTGKASISFSVMRGFGSNVIFRSIK